MPRGRPRKPQGPTVKDTIIQTLSELISLLDAAPDMTAHLQWKDGMIECRHCFRSAPTAKDIRHFGGSKAGEVINDVVQVFGEPPCPMIAVQGTVDKAKKLLALLKEAN